MTTFVFTPSTSVVFQFQPTLDGNQYNALVPWSLFGKRYYLRLFDLSNNLVAAIPLIGSGAGINLQALEWDDGRAEGTTISPHGLTIGEVTQLSVSGCLPDNFNGLFNVFATGRTTFEYDMPDPGVFQATLLGQVSYDINLMAPYFKTSRMVFRQQTQTFEVTP